jgi:hypothetical protein
MEDGQMPPEVMNEIAVAAATATQQVTGQAQAMAQAQAIAQQNPQVEMFQQQLQLEKEQLAQKEQEDLRDKDIEMMRIEAQREATQTRAAIDLEELQAKTQNDEIKNLNEVLKTVRETRTNQGEENE